MTNPIQKYISDSKEAFEENIPKTVSDGGFLADVPDDYEPLDFDTDSIKSFIISRLNGLADVIKKEVGRLSLPSIVCVQTIAKDDGVHQTYRCQHCGQEWGEEISDPHCKNDTNYRVNSALSTIISLLTEAKEIKNNNTKE